MKKNRSRQVDLSDKEFSQVINCEETPSNEQIMSSELSRGMQSLNIVEFGEKKNVNFDKHSVLISEYHQIGNQIFFKGYEVVIKKVVGCINLKDRSKSKLKISKTELPFSELMGEEED